MHLFLKLNNQFMQEGEVEVWKCIPGLKAEASSLGRIKSFYAGAEGKIRKLQKGLRAKYLRVQLQHRGKYYSVHRLVAEAWHPNPKNYPIIRHLDDNGLNNRPKNLKWDSQSNNIKFGKKGKKTRHTQLMRRVIREAFRKGHSKLAIGNYFRITDTSVRRVVEP